MNDDETPYDTEDPEEDEPAYDCHLTEENDGWWCGKAGSEECDFECPYSRLIGTNGDDELDDPEAQEKP